MSTLQFEESIHQELESLRTALAEAEEESAALRSQYSQMRELIRKNEEDSKASSKDLKEAKEKEQQLERVIQFLRKRTEESHLGISDLDAQFQKSQSTLKGITEELENSRHEIQDLNLAIDDERHQKDLLEKTLQELRTDYEALKATTQSEYQINFENELKERDASIESLRNDLEQLRFQALKEIQAAQSDLQNKEAILKETYEEKHQEMHRKDADYLHQIQILLEEKHELAKQLEESAQAIHDKRLLEDSYSKLQLEYQHTSHRLQEVTTHSKSQFEETESRLRMAQQHLAKRVREATLINEKNEELRNKLLEIQSQYSESKLRVTELQNTLEVEMQHHKRSYDKMNESLHHLEIQLDKWEKKYFQLHEIWQETEEKNRKLLKTEEKFHEMQKLLGQLGNIMSNPVLFTQVPTIQLKESTPEPPLESHEPPSLAQEETLFNRSTNSQKYRDSLFD